MGTRCPHDCQLEAGDTILQYPQFFTQTQGLYNMTTNNLNIRKAKLNDADGIHQLVNSMAKKDLMLPRALSEIYENIRDFYICEIDGKLIGCSALHITWIDLAEIRSVVVDCDYQGKGIGNKLVNQCLDEAKEIGLKKIFALTYVSGFFRKLGFTDISKEELPHKIWNDCIKCPKFPNCNEEALIKNI